MYLRLVIPIALLASATCNDIEQGLNATEARKIFDEKKEASPAVWRQIEKVTVNTTDAEVISRVVVTDLRPNKDGDASIIEGGEGNQTVTIELKSPTALRGYDFHIEVYAVPNTHPDASTPALVGNDKPKDQWKPSKEDDLKLRNIGGDIQPPSAFGADSSTKPPVPLATDVKINDGKRIMRSTEDAKKVDAVPNHPVSFADPKESTTESDPAKKVPVTETKETDTQKSIEASTHLPTTTVSYLKQKDEHARQARDTEKKTQSTTQAPTTSKPAKNLKDDFDQEMVYPQWHVDKTSGNTDKLLLPVEPEMEHDDKEVKSKKDGNITPVPLATTTTVKPRVVRDTEITSPKTDLKDKLEQDDKHVQKIPSNGRVTIPEGWKDLNSTTPKTGLEKQDEESGNPQHVPAFQIPSVSQEHLAWNGPCITPPTTKSVKSPSSSDESESTESSEAHKLDGNPKLRPYVYQNMRLVPLETSPATKD